MEFSNNYQRLGNILTRKLRDENYNHYCQIRDFGQSMSKDEYYKLPRNPNLHPELQRLKDERFEFFNDLNETQLKILDRLVLSLLDLTAFNFLREIEENLFHESSLGMTIDGQKVEEISTEFLSGTMFGEYFLWIEKNSKYGKFQQ